MRIHLPTTRGVPRILLILLMAANGFGQERPAPPAGLPEYPQPGPAAGNAAPLALPIEPRPGETLAMVGNMLG
jgi:hypothetical protein